MTDSKPLKFRLATPQDAAAFCALSNSLYARPVNEAYYDWQFFKCPFPSLLNLAVDENDELVGTYCLHVQNGVAWVLDIMVSPKFQRQGIFRQLVDFGFENLKQYDAKAIVVMANEKADRACVNGLGWTRINTFLTAFATPKKSEKFTLEYEKIEIFPEIKLPTKLFSNTRTSDYQNWRFIENARYSYDIFAARKNGGLFGYVVLKIFRDPVSNQAFGDIVDMIWAENDEESLADMLRFSLNHFAEQKVGNAAMWLQTNTLLDNVGLEVGFKQSEQQRFFCGKSLREDYKYLENAENWFINMADSEVY